MTRKYDKDDRAKERMAKRQSMMEKIERAMTNKDARTDKGKPTKRMMDKSIEDNTVGKEETLSEEFRRLVKETGAKIVPPRDDFAC